MDDFGAQICSIQIIFFVFLFYLLKKIGWFDVEAEKKRLEHRRVSLEQAPYRDRYGVLNEREWRESQTSVNHNKIGSNHHSNNHESNDSRQTTIVQNITYNIQDSAISGDISNEVNDK